MYAQVVVLTYQSPEIDSYTYEIPKNLNVKIGQLVEVPFGKRTPQGIIMSIVDRPSATVKNIKPISKIVLEQPILLPYQIELLKWMSAFYIAPMVNCLEAMLPTLPRPSTLANGLSKNSTIVDKRSPIGQSLVLVPTINRIPETLAKFPKAKSYVIYHNEQITSERFQNCQKIASGQTEYIFSSRAGIFAPCPNLKEIIIYDEHDGAYKDERSPYYDTLTIAQKITELTKAQLKIVDPSPKITTYFSLRNHIKIQKFGQDVRLIDMVSEKQSGRHSPISFTLEEEINLCLQRKGEVLLFLNKKKESGHMFCKSCKTSAHLEKQPSICPNCNSADIFWNVLNIKSLEAEVKKLFPNSINSSSGDGRLSVVDMQSKIDIETAAVFYSPLVKKYDLAGHIQTDSLLNLADYTSAEKLYSQVTQLKKQLKDSGKLYLQTYNLEHPTISKIDVGNWEAFYNAELSQRKQLFYPPFSVLIKLALKSKYEEKVYKDAHALTNRLRSSIVDRQLTILGPYKPTFWQRQPTYHIILKYKITNYSLKNRQKVIEIMKKYLEKGNKNYTIEVEPDSIQ